VEPRKPDPALGQSSASVVVAACAASAGAHAALVVQHLDDEPQMEVAFIAATALLLVVAAALTYRPRQAGAGRAATLLLAALIGAYALNVTAGLPWLSEGPEAVDVVGLATKAVEALGLVFAIRLSQTMGSPGSLTQRRLNP
jgi:Na+/melibiose symporter-like transporter